MTRLAIKSPRTVCLQLGTRMRARRLALLMPQAELARRAGVSVGTIKNLESKPWSTSLEHLVCAAVSLGLGNQLAPLFKLGPRPRPVLDLRLPGSRPRMRARPRRHKVIPRADAAASAALAAGYGFKPS